MLQGSLENFALDEVLGLLSGTSKTGQLEIAGNRGTGSLTFSDGRLVDASASYTANGSGLEDVMFELLRYDDGTFTFANREVTPTDNIENVASVLASAEHRLRDWRSIEAVVPSLNHQIAPSEELPEDEMTITRPEWAALTIIAAGCPVSLVCDRLDLGEVEGSRQIKNLAERGLVTVTEPIGSYISSMRANQAAARAEETTLPAVSVSPAVAYDAPAPPIESAPIENGSAPAVESAPVENGFAPAEASVTADIPVAATERPPMPAAPAADELVTEVEGLADAVPPAPPSPAEISSFSEEIEDVSELVTEAEETKGGGLLARYLKSDD